jgi:hypothetical protein
VVRPGRAPCGARAALSWDHAALRGDDPLAATDIGSVGPLGVSTPSGLLRGGRARRIAPPHALRVPCASLQRSIAAPPHRPGPRRDARRTMLPSLGSRAPRHMPERRSVSAGRPAPKRAARGLGTSSATMTTVPAENLSALRASSGFTLQGVLLAPVGLPLGSPCPPAVARVGSPRPLRSVRTRSASGPRSRRRARSVRGTLAGVARRCLPGLRPSRAFAPSGLAGALFALAPSSRVGQERRPVPPASRGLPARRDRLAPLGAAGSPRICHLATVAASLGPCAGRAHEFALRLAACTRPEPL